MSEKTKRFLRDTAVLGTAALLVRFAAILSNRLITARIGAAGMGLCALVMSVGAFAVTVSTAGVGFAVSRLIPEAEARGERGAARAICRTALLFSGALGLLSGGILALLAPSIGGRLLGDARTVPALYALAASLPFTALSSALSGYFLAIRRSRRSGVIRVCEQLMRMLLCLLLLSLTADRGMTYACLAVVGASAIAEGVSCLFLTASYFSFAKEREITPVYPMRGAARLLAATAFPILLSSLIRSGLSSVEHLLIPRALLASGTDYNAALASYGTLSGMAIPITLLPMAFFSSAAGLLVPECAELGRGAVKNLARRALSATLGIGVFLGALLLLLSEPLGRLTGLGEPLCDYLRLLAPVLPLMLLDHITDAILRGIGEQVHSMWVNIADSLLSIFLVLLLIPPLGARGYVAVILLAECFNLALSLGHLIRTTGLSIDLSRALLPPLLLAGTSIFSADFSFLSAFFLQFSPFLLRLRFCSASNPGSASENKQPPFKKTEAAHFGRKLFQFMRNQIIRSSIRSARRQRVQRSLRRRSEAFRSQSEECRRVSRKRGEGRDFGSPSPFPVCHLAG